MAEKQALTHNALFIGGFNLLIVLLALAIFSGDDSPTSKLKIASLATGEWAPYSGEQLPRQGVAAAIVSEVLQNMGYQAQLNFMPWPQAETATASAESDTDIRATFPYSQVGDRERDFYFSVPILAVEYAAFYNPAVISLEELDQALAKTAATLGDWEASTAGLDSQTVNALRAHRKLLDKQQTVEVQAAGDNPALVGKIKAAYQRKFTDVVGLVMSVHYLHARIINLSGYKFPQFLAAFMDSEQQQVSDNREAIKLLKHSPRRLLLLEANKVAKDLLRDHFADDYLAIYGTLAKSAASNPATGNLRKAPLSYEGGVHIMAGKKNPENYRFIKHFDREFVALKKNGKIAALKLTVERDIESRSMVQLQKFNNEGFLTALTKPTPGSDYVILASGTHAIVLEWSAAHLQTHSQPKPNNPQGVPRQLQPGLVKVRIQQGPHNGKVVYIDGRSIHIP